MRKRACSRTQFGPSYDQVYLNRLTVAFCIYVGGSLASLRTCGVGGGTRRPKRKMGKG